MTPIRCLLLLALVTLFATRPGVAQYMYLDANGDGLCTSQDRLNVPGGTVVDVWLQTDRNKDGSPATCETEGTLTLFAYQLILRATEGTVAWGSYVNNMSTMATSLGEGSDSTDLSVGFAGSTELSPGTYKLGSVNVMVTRGAPRLSIAEATPLGAYATFFGSGCFSPSARMLGSEWADTDGLAASAQTVFPYPETFDYPAGTAAEPWNESWNPWRNGLTQDPPNWGLSSAGCGNYLGTFSATGVGGYCDSYPYGVNNALTLETALNTSSMMRWWVSFVETHSLVLAAGQGDSDDRLWYAIRGGGYSTEPLPYTLLGDIAGYQGLWVRREIGPAVNSFPSYDYSYGRPAFGMQTFHESPFGTYGAWIDSVQIYGVRWPDIYAYGDTSSGTSSGITPMTAGQTWYLRSTFGNAGDTLSGSFHVEVLLDGTSFASWVEPGIAARGARTINKTMSGSSIAAGNHTVQIRLDSWDEVHESNTVGEPELNNTRPVKIFTWVAPDLVIVEPINAPLTAKMGQTVAVGVTIKNQGNASADSFRLAWYKDRTSPPPVNTAPDSSILVASLGAGLSATFTFLRSSAQAGTDSMYAYVDYQNDVQNEGNEGNNVSLPRLLVWVPKTIVVRGTFVYDDSVLEVTTSTACARVSLYDVDGTAYEHLASVGVRNNLGEFEFPAIANQDQDGGFLDLRVKVFYESDDACWNAMPSNLFVSMRDDLNLPWSFESDPFDDASLDTLSIAMQPTTYGHRMALHMLKTIVDRPWSLLRRENVYPVPAPVPGVKIRWAPGYNEPTSYRSGDSTIFINGSEDLAMFCPDEGDDALLVHEYAHHINFHLRLDHADPIGQTDTTASYLNPHTNLRASWREGLADFVAAACTRYRWESGFGVITDYGRGPEGAWREKIYDPEENTLTFYQLNSTQIDTIYYLNAPCPPNPCRRGPFYTGTVAASLWDLYDLRTEPGSATFFADSIGDSSAYNILYGLHDSPNAVDPKVQDVLDAAREYNLFVNPSSDRTMGWHITWAFWRHGIFPDGYVVGADDPAIESGTFGINSVSPNPFNPTTRIHFNIPDDGQREAASVRVYDVGGRFVRELLRRRLEAGPHLVTWDGTNQNGLRVASGLYFLRLERGGASSTRKISVLK